MKALKTRLDAAASEITAAISEASQAIETVRSDWQTRYKDFQSRLDAELEKVDGQSSLTSLRLHLGSLQQMLAETKAAKEELAQDAIPDLSGRWRAGRVRSFLALLLVLPQSTT